MPDTGRGVRNRFPKSLLSPEFSSDCARRDQPTLIGKKAVDFKGRKSKYRYRSRSRPQCHHFSGKPLLYRRPRLRGNPRASNRAQSAMGNLGFTHNKEPRYAATYAEKHLSQGEPRQVGNGALSIQFAAMSILLEGLPYRCLERRQIVRDAVPDRLQINPLVSMPEVVSDSPNRAPRLVRNFLLRPISQPDRRFADVCSFRSTAATAIVLERKASKSIPDVNSSISPIALTISRNQRCEGGSKDKDRLSSRLFEHFRPKHLSIG